MGLYTLMMKMLADSVMGQLEMLSNGQKEAVGVAVGVGVGVSSSFPLLSVTASAGCSFLKTWN